MSRNNPSDVITRVWEGGDADIENFNSFSLLTWNILADGLAQHGGFEGVQPEILDWSHRWLGIFHEISNVDPDIICLQECNHSEALATMFPSHYIFTAPKLDSAALSLAGKPPDGTVVLVRRSRFEIKNVRIHYLSNPGHVDALSNQNAIFLGLKDKIVLGKSIVVVVTHLKAKYGSIIEATRNHQILELLQQTGPFRDQLASYSSSSSGGSGSSSRHIPIILCGDLNAPPTEKTYASVFDAPFHFSSAYNSQNRRACVTAQQYALGEPAFSTWKFRRSASGPTSTESGDEPISSSTATSALVEKSALIDYIFFTDHKNLQGEKEEFSPPPTLILASTLRIPSKDELGGSGLPSLSYPSDHIALAAQFYWADDNSKNAATEESQVQCVIV